MTDAVRLRRRIRLLAVVCVGLIGLSAYGWLKPRPGTEAPVADEDAEELRERISRAGFAERVRLLHQIGQSGGQGAVGAVLEMLRQAQTDRVRQAAIAQLGSIGGHTAVEELYSIACGVRVRLRFHAIAALGRMASAPAVERLLELLGNAEPVDRRAVVSALGAAGGPEAARTLTKLARDAHDPHRRAAIAALGRTGSPSALETLQRLVAGSELAIRRQAVMALGELGTLAAKGELIRLARTGPGELRVVATTALGNYSGDDVQVVLAALARDKDPELARAALRALGDNQGGLAQQALIDVVQQGRGRERQEALQALARSRSPEARALLIEALGDSQLVGTAAWELAELGDAESRAALLQVMQSDEASPATRRAVMSALGSVKGAEVGQVLDDLLRRGSPDVAAGALQHLVKRAGKNAKPMLLQAFREGSHAVRTTALQALAELGDPASRDLFVKAAQSGDYTMSYSAIHGLVKLRGPESRAALVDLVKNGPQSSRSVAAHALAGLGGDQARAALITSIKQEGGGQVAAALGQMRDPQTRRALRDLVDDPGVSKQVKMQLVASLDPSDVEALARVADHPDADVAAQALAVLGRSGGRAAERALGDALSSTDIGRKKAAVNGLAQLGTPSALKSLSSALDDPETFGPAVNALAGIGGKRAMSALSERFQASEAEQRREIVARLGNRADPGARGLLRSALHDQDEQVAIRAAQALASVGSAAERNQLLSLMQTSSSKQLRHAIAQQLTYLGGGIYRTHRQLIDQIVKQGG